MYRVIPDEEASKHGYIRVIDESGEDYGYSAERFFVLNVPRPVALALTSRSDKPARRPGKSVAAGLAKGARGLSKLS